MRRIEVIPGQEYDQLTVIKEVEAKGKRHVLCKCSCGNKVAVRLGHLRSGHSTTCGRCGILFQGRKKTVAQWARDYGIKESTLRARLKLMDISEALKRT
jgi:hypothetical protein